MLKRVILSGGFWNSLNSGDTGADGPPDAPWYESRLYASLGVRLAGDVTLASSFTTYTSPNGMFATASELGIRVGWDDREKHRLSLNPYTFAAFELGVAPGRGQLDGGQSAGIYLESGVRPVYTARRFTVAVPVKVGLSLANYYELAGRDHVFGFASVGADLVVPFPVSRGGRWQLRGGVELLGFGDATRVYNGGDESSVVASIGIGLSY
jgi:hypothetical protein